MINTLFNNKILNQFDNLKTIIDRFGEDVEGNFVCYNTTDNIVIDRNKDKILNLKNLSKDKKNICEIGVNAGHSLLIMLDSNPTASYTLFDINMHEYTEPCLEYIKSEYPSTNIEIIFGDSRVTLPEYFALNREKRFDMMHVDGGHHSSVVMSDYFNSLQLTNNDGIIIFDDYNLKNIKKFLDEKLEKEIFEISDKIYVKNDYHIAYRKK